MERTCTLKTKGFPHIILLCALITVTTACHKGDTTVKAVLPADSLLREGDLVFRRGVGLISRAVLAADEHGRFSHIGIIVRKGNNWMVVHAVPGEPEFKGDSDRVKMEPVASFFSSEKAKSGAIMRVNARSAVCCAAARRAEALYRKRVLFDYAYDLQDSARMYCTELIEYVYRLEKVDISGGKLTSIHIPGFNGKFLLPGDVLQSKKLTMIYQY
jgi:hypothetical protein